MDFGDVLDEWERLSSRPGGLDRAMRAERRAHEAEEDLRRKASLAASAEAERKKREEQRRLESSRLSMEAWLDRHGVVDKDARPEGASSGAEEAKRIAALKPGARLDLHGKTVAEAEHALGIFLEDAAKRGIEKVLVITGKGNHSTKGGVLAKAVKAFLEANPRAGRFGTADRANGGSGALWIVVRRLISPGR